MDLKELELEVSHLKRDSREIRKEVDNLRSDYKNQSEMYLTMFKEISQDLGQLKQILVRVRYWFMGALTSLILVLAVVLHEDVISGLTSILKLMT